MAKLKKPKPSERRRITKSFTISQPVMDQIRAVAAREGLPVSRIVERALRIYLPNLEKATLDKVTMDNLVVYGGC